MDRAALAAALSAGLLAPSGGWAEDQEPADLGVICGASSSATVVQTTPLETGSRSQTAA